MSLKIVLSLKCDDTLCGEHIMLDVFFKDKSQYTNKLNLVQGYIDQLTTYIQTKRNIAASDARAKAIEIFKAKFNDKHIKYFERQDNGDRVVKNSTLMNYINDNLKSENVIAPTFTSYINTKNKKSILADFIFTNVRKRSQAKKLAQKAKTNNDIDLFISKNNEQKMMKIYNNSLSGVFSQEACVLHNPTAHNTLTSLTRTITSLSNASNEKLIAGNRYYPRPIDVLNDIVYITTYLDVENIKEICDKYNLYLPTVGDTVKALKYSSDLYFKDDSYYSSKIATYLANLTPYHLAGICYTSDLYTLRVFNDSVIRNMFRELTTPVVSSDILESVDEIYSIDESLLCYVHCMFFTKIKGYGKDYVKMNNGLASSVLYTARAVRDTLWKYKDLFNTFFTTTILPSNSFRLKNMVRRTVVLSDTDSTCFTLDEWIRWYKGEFFIDDESISLAGCLSYITSQTIVNQLAILSKNMNIDTELLHTLAMKNEYLWTVHVPAEVSKHYFAYTVMQEGSVYSKPEIEIKGVHLKNSAVPVDIIKDSNALIESILTTVNSNKKIKLNSVITHIADLEKSIISSVTKGETVYLKKSKVKNKEAYALDEFKSPFQRHVFWTDVFSSKYGEVAYPPYDTVKLPTTILTRANLVAWVESIEDTSLRDRLLVWLTNYNKKSLPTVYLNISYVLSNGVPIELSKIIDIKKIVLDTTLQHRIILESLGVMLNENRLIKDQFNL